MWVVTGEWLASLHAGIINMAGCNNSIYIWVLTGINV